MQAEELMIYDYVTNEGVVMRLTGTDLFDLYMGYMDEPSPIPLTAEILEANGFVKDGYTNLSPDYRYEGKGISIYINLHTTCDKDTVISIHNSTEAINKDVTFGGRNIKSIYVHELQHALRFVGLNKLADQLIV